MDVSTPAQDLFFAGDSRHSLDPKNRVALPARWFKRTEELTEFYLIKHLRRPCLVLYPPETFRRVLEESMQNVHDPDERQDIRRDLSSLSQLVTPDKQRRVVISEELCRAAGLKGEVNLIGNYDRIEIWDAKVWDARVAERRPQLPEKTRHVAL